MNPAERVHTYYRDYFDTVILKIKRGDIKCGKYANRVKIDKKFDASGKELFNDGSTSDSERR